MAITVKREPFVATIVRNKADDGVVDYVVRRGGELINRGSVRGGPAHCVSQVVRYLNLLVVQEVMENGGAEIPDAA